MRARTYSWKLPLLYSLLTALPATGLVLLGLNSIREQQRAVAELVRANRLLAGERLAGEIESMALRDAERCLQQVELTRLTRPVKDWHSDCGFAEFYLIAGRTVVYPAEAPELARALAGVLAYHPPLEAGRIYPLAFQEPLRAQLFYIGRGEMTLAMHMKPEYVTELAFKTAQATTRVKGRLVDVRDKPPEIFFHSLFPFWGLTIEDPVDKPGSPAFAVLTIFAGCLLLAGMAFTLRRWRMSLLRERFVSGVSHQLRTPLSSIRLY